MPAYKLVYFDGRGRAECARWIFAQAGVAYEDKRINKEEWAELKPNTPTGTLPYLQVDDVKIGGSGAITMYLAKELGLAGSSNIDEANIRCLYDTLEDSMQSYMRFKYCDNEEYKEKLRKEYMEKTLPAHLNVFSSRLENDKQWLVGDKVSLADIAVSSVLEHLTGDDMTALVSANKPVSDLINRVKELPNIKAWIESRPATQF